MQKGGKEMLRGKVSWFLLFLFFPSSSSRLAVFGSFPFPSSMSFSSSPLYIRGGVVHTEEETNVCFPMRQGIPTTEARRDEGG